MVRAEGLEPPRLSSLEPKSSASTNSATSAAHRLAALGVETFGQSADLPDLYGALHLDADAIIDAAARVLLE